MLIWAPELLLKPGLRALEILRKHIESRIITLRLSRFTEQPKALRHPILKYKRSGLDNSVQLKDTDIATERGFESGQVISAVFHKSPSPW